ncbi:MAG: hypothetical protein J6J61_09055, partial [Muribaculaceae bacterium]|nr:hypothetical protein [Muribaculaceae bacterium]
FDTASYSGPLFTGKADKNHSIWVQPRAYGHNSARIRTDLYSPVRGAGRDIEAAKDFFIGSATVDTIMQRIYHNPLRKNKDYTYSCLNFCLLMDMEQNLTG